MSTTNPMKPKLQTDKIETAEALPHDEVITMSTPMTKIREQWREYENINLVDQWPTAVDDIADWWLNRFKEELESLAGEVEKEIIGEHGIEDRDIEFSTRGHNNAIRIVLSILQSKINSLKE